MADDQDNTSEQCVLKGQIKVDGDKAEMGGKVVALLNLNIQKYALSGSRIEKVSVNLKGNTSLGNFKDDFNVSKRTRMVTQVRDLQYAF